MKIATWNVNSIRVRLPHILDWLKLHSPDILALQETKVEDKNFPIEALNKAGYQCIYSGQKTYNGVAILSKKTAEAVVSNPDELNMIDIGEKRFLAATYGDTRVVNLYVVNGQEIGCEKYTYKLDWLQKIHQYLSHEIQKYPKIVVLGDFNIAPESADIHDPNAWKDNVLCSDNERAALKKITDLGLDDTYRLFKQAENNFSWWDYRAAGFRRNRGLRIDLILASHALNCRQCWIDKEPRMWERPSDHAPVIAEFTE